MLNVRVDLVLQESKMDNVFFVCVGFAIYALVNYVLNMYSAYKEYKKFMEWMNSRGISTASLDKRDFAKYLSIYRLTEIEGVEVVSIDDPK